MCGYSDLPACRYLCRRRCWRRGRCGRCSRCRWLGLRHRRAVVARVASHVIARLVFTDTCGEVGVYLTCHQDHLSRRFLLGLGVTGEIALHVTSGALHTKRCAEQAHRGTHFFRLQNLQVLRRRTRLLGAGRRWRRGFLTHHQQWRANEREQNQVSHGRNVTPFMHNPVVTFYASSGIRD